MENQEHEKYFAAALLRWHSKDNTRDMPWKGEKDPYKIWLSEIILQQTRVEQGTNYYRRFIEAFPTVSALATANETKVFKLWEGLGYYSRCKNLIATAKRINDEFGAVFPGKYPDILQLKGVGPYTAAAIASFAFELPHAVVDGNVFRVLARYFAVPIPIDSTRGRHYFTQLANQLLDKRRPGIYNQAIMDFGALVCKPQSPLCSQCPLKAHCGAYHNGSVQQLPVKEKRITKRSRWFSFIVINYNGFVYVRKRAAGDIWENLYEFPVLEKDNATELANLEDISAFLGKQHFKLEQISGRYKQLLTHQTIQGQFIRIKINSPLNKKGYKIISRDGLSKLPFPKLISNYLKDKNVSLNLF